MNFRVCVLGDVARPGQLVVQGERLTIFEALSMVGDLTIYGQRHNVTIIREENGLRTIGEIDLSSQSVFDSPYYYLHQNDVVYVEPNMRKKKNAERDPMVMSYISSAVSIVSMLTSAFYYYILSRNYLNR
jgi:polysaccharide export outer membrane protein